MARLPADGRTELLEHEVDTYTKTAKRLVFNASAFDQIVSGQIARLMTPTTGSELIEVHLDTVKTRSAQTHTIQGKIAGEPLSDVQFVYHDGIVHGNVTHPAKSLHYEYRSLSDGHMMVRELDHAAMTARCGDPKACDGPEGCDHSDHGDTESPSGDTIQDELADSGAEMPISNTEEGSVAQDTSDWITVDVVVGYGQAARQEDGGTSQIEARILDAIDRMNTAFVNSGITNTEMMLLGTIEDPDYVFPGATSGSMGSGDELGDLDSTSDGILDAVTDYADQLGADFRAFIVKGADGSAGIAYRPGRSSITALTYITPIRLTFAHELGHNLGCGHSWGDTSQSYNAHYGWRLDPDGDDTTTNDRVRTIMAYDFGWGNRIAHYANPKVLYGNAPTGAELGEDVSGNLFADQRYVAGGLGYSGSDSEKSGFDGTNLSLGARNYLTILNGQGRSGYGAVHASDHSTRAAFNVATPAANSEFTPGETFDIFFTGGDQKYTATITLHKGGVFNATIATDLNPATDRIYSWSIPGSQASGADYFVRVTLSHPSYGEVISDSDQFSISDRLRFSSESFNITEDAGSATITVERAGSAAAAISVDYATSDGTATAGSDYTTTNGTLNWGTGDNSAKTFNVAIIDDNFHGPPEKTITLTLSNPSGGAVIAGDNNPASLVIGEDDNQSPEVDAGTAQSVTLTGTEWSPGSLNPALWLDADDAGTITLNGDTVSKWSDKSGNSRHATQTTSSYQASYTSEGLNGRDILSFDGSTDYFNVDLDFMAGVDHSVFVVTQANNYTDIYGAANGSQGANSLHVGFRNSTSYRMNFWSNDWYGTISPNFQSGAANLLNYVWQTGTSKEIFANGQSEGSTGDAGTIGTMAGGGRIGKVVTHLHYDGDIAEFIAFGGTLGLVDRQELEGFLAHKWGTTALLAADHPYKNQSPNNLSGSASLSGTASDGDDDTLNTGWALADGPAPITFENPQSLATTVSFTQAGTYTLRLTADDGYETSFSEVTITVEKGMTYDNWIDGYDVGGQTAFEDDYDGDGIKNGVENYFGTDPSVENYGVSAGTFTTGADTTFTFTHPLNEEPATDISASYLWSKDLVNFYGDGESDDDNLTTVSFSQDTPSEGMVSVSAAVNGASPDKLFIRIEVLPASP